MAPTWLKKQNLYFSMIASCVLRFLHLLQDSSDEQLQVAVRYARYRYAAFRFWSSTFKGKSALLSQLQSGFFREFGGQPALQKQLNDRYRHQQAFITRHFNPENDAENGIARSSGNIQYQV